MNCTAAIQPTMRFVPIKTEAQALTVANATGRADVEAENG